MRRFAPPTALAVLAALLLCACGGSRKPAATSTPAKSSKAAIAFSECMRANGVPNFPDPTGNGIGIQVQQNNGQMTVNGVSVNAPAFEKAQQTCQSKLPTPPPLSEAQIASITKGALKMAECMRANGVPNFPDPKVSAGPGGRGVRVQMGASGSNPGFNPQSPAFERAQQKCATATHGKGFAIAVAPGKQKAAASSGSVSPANTVKSGS